MSTECIGPNIMPLKVKLPLDVKKQHKCPNCPYQTKNETALENHLKECQAEVPNGLPAANGTLENHPVTKKDHPVTKKNLKRKGSTGEKGKKKVKKSKKDKGKIITNGSNVPKGDAQTRSAEVSEIGDEDAGSSNGDDANEHKVVVRHYSCKLCGFMSTSSKAFLFHERDEHEKDIDIYPCDLCDYASKWKCKVVRHREMIHRGIQPPKDFEKIKSPHRANGKPGPKLEKSPKTPLSMVPTPEVFALPENLGLLGKVDSPNALLKLGSKKKSSKEKKSVKRKKSIENAEVPEENKKRVTDGRSQGKSSYLQFMELCSAEGAEPRYKCKLCFYSNLRKWQIRQHVKARHVNAKAFQCTIGTCTFSTYKKAEFFAHKTKHNQMTYRCKECEYVTFLKPNLDRHKLNHGMLNVAHKCSLCSYASAKEAAVMRHAQEHHMTSDMTDEQVANTGSENQAEKINGDGATVPFENGLPGKRQSTLDRYYSRLQDFPDAQNQRSNGAVEHERYMDMMDDYENHSDYAEENEEADMSDVIGDTAFMCPMCGFAANSVEKLNAHMLTHGYDADGREVDVDGEACPENDDQPGPEEKIERKEVKKIKEERVIETDYQPRENGAYLQSHYSSMNSLLATDDEKSVEDNAQVQGSSFEQNALVSTNGDVVCNICGYVAVTMTRLKGHMVSHSNDYKYTCDLCPRKYKRSSDLNFHMKKAHNIRLRDYLQGSKEQDEPLNLSMRSNTSNESGSISTDGPEPMDFIEDDMLSDDCGQYDQPLDLSRHDVKEEELTGLDMQCPQCPYIAKWPSDMRRHSLVHALDRRYKCDACPRTYKWQGDLNVHMKKFHEQGDAPVITDVVVAPYSTPPKNKKGVAGEYKCSYCDYIAKYTSELMRHTRIHTHEKPYRCRFCQYDTAWKGDLKRHIEKHHRDKLTDEKAIYSILVEIEREVNETFGTDSNPPDSDVTSIVSEEAEPLAASTPMKLDQALPGLIPESMPLDLKQQREEDPCLCKICGWRAPLPSKLHMHLVAHDNIKIYKCTICGFRTNWVWDTRKHVRAKHCISDPGPYCLKMNEDEARMTIKQYLESRDKSGKTVNNNNIIPDKDALVQESPGVKPEKLVKGGAANHGYVRPFKCSECPRRSNWKWELKKHIKVVHEENAHCIILTKEEALATLPPGLTVGQKLNISDNVKEAEKPKPTILKTPSLASVSALFRPSPPSKAPKTPMSTPTASPAKAMSPAKAVLSPSVLSPSVASKGSNQVDHDRCKKFKCSVCPYRSNYRSDVQRHVYNKHRKAGEVILLEKEEAQETLQEYLDTFPGKKFMGKSKRKLHDSMNSSFGTPSPDDGKKKQKKWKCNKCEFRHVDRDAVLEHLAEHSRGIQAFSCKMCNFSSDFLTAVHRHIHSVHQLPDQENWVINEERKELDCLYFPGSQNGKANTADLYKFEEEDQPELLPAGDGFVEKRFRCKQCGARSNWKNAMYRHIREVHSLTSYNLIEELSQGPDGLIAIPHIPRGDLHPSSTQDSVKHTNVMNGALEMSGMPVGAQVKLEVPDTESIEREAIELQSLVDHTVLRRNSTEEARLQSLDAPMLIEPEQSSFAMPDEKKDRKDGKEPTDSTGSDGGDGGGNRRSSDRQRESGGDGQNDGQRENDGKREGGDGQGGKRRSNGGQRENNRGQRDNNGGSGDKGGEKPNDGDKPGKKKEKSEKKKKKKKKKKESTSEVQDETEGDKNTPGSEKVNTKKTVKKERGDVKTPGSESVTQSSKKLRSPSSPKKAFWKTQPKSQGWPKTKGGIYREGKTFGCTICHYKSVKSQNVQLHQRMHIKRPGHEVKCPHCPYYVQTERFLQNHLKGHEVFKASAAPQASTSQDSTETGDSESMEIDVVGVDSPAPRSTEGSSEIVAVAAADADTVLADVAEIASNTIMTDGRRKIYNCPQCPYLTRSKTDMLYHKQFHRKRPVTKYKCTKCDYWSIHKRTSTQHEKVHDPAWRANRLEALKAPPKPGNGKGNKTPPVAPAVASVQSSPAKSEVSERSYADYDPVDIASIKQDLIMSKIMAVPLTTLEEEKEELARKLEDSPLKTEPPVLREPLPSGSDSLPSDVEMPILSPGLKLNRPNLDTSRSENEDGVGGTEQVIQPQPRRMGRQQKEVATRKLHRCRYCPYTNIRGSNLRLHEQMHGVGTREGESLHKCPKCDYHVGNRGLLSHHLKVHALNFQPEFLEPEATTSIKDEDKVEEAIVPTETECKPKQDGVPFMVKYDGDTRKHIIHPTVYKKYSCEKCPYGTSKRSQFEKHFLLHGSKQKFTCEFCDYSVPLNSLLVQHKKLHLMPNQNLLAVQSISNLQHLPELPADVAVAMVADSEKKPEDPIAQYSGIHDHLELFENGMEYEEPKKLYRCDRCPYTNVRRDHLLMHLKCHMIRSDLQCPYCDYSVTKQNILNQHMHVHFGPLTVEEEIIFNGENRPKSDAVNTGVLDLTKKSGTKTEQSPKPDAAASTTAASGAPSGAEPDKMPLPVARVPEHRPRLTDPRDSLLNEWTCRYCDRQFPVASLLVKHEMQHLIGNHF